MRQGWTRIKPEFLAIGLTLSIGSGPILAQSPAVSPEEIVLPDAMLGNQVAPMLLLTRPEVRSELGLSTEQTESARKTLADLRAQAQAIRGKGNESAAIARRRLIDEAQTRWLRDNLNSEQALRLGQIDLQWQGPWALSRTLSAEMLGLSEEQATRIRRLLSEAPTAPETIDRVIAVLTPTQLERWRSLLGKPVAFSKAKADPGLGRVSTNSGTR
ncbi:MAG: hypothetical protein U0800_11415 [Isosphaeraceae bacterium]